MRDDGSIVPLSEMLKGNLEVEDVKPKHAKKPETFVLSANGERYRNTKYQRKKARKAQRASRKRNR